MNSILAKVSSTTVDIKHLVVANLFEMPAEQNEQSLQFLHHVIGCKGAKELGSGAFATAFGGKIEKAHLFDVDPEKMYAVKFYNTVKKDYKHK